MPSATRTVLLAAIFTLALFAPAARAQRGFGGGGGGGGARGGGFPGRVEGRDQRGFNNWFGLGWGFLPPYHDEGPGYWTPAQPQYIPHPVVMQQPQPAPQPKSVEPLMMEERDGKWVRVQSGSDLPTGSEGEAPASTRQPPLKLPRAVVVFRDGHQEEVAKYTIEGNVLYTSADYWTTGAWTRKIPISDLDVPTTLKLNQERGTKFTLPSSPNEVMVRF